MIEKFETGKWYRYTKPTRGSRWNTMGSMDYVLDMKPHKCCFGNRVYASLSENDQHLWLWNLEDFEEVTVETLLNEIEQNVQIIRDMQKPKPFTGFEKGKWYTYHGRGEDDWTPTMNFIFTGKHQVTYINKERTPALIGFNNMERAFTWNEEEHPEDWEEVM